MHLVWGKGPAEGGLRSSSPQLHHLAAREDRKKPLYAGGIFISIGFFNTFFENGARRQQI